MPDLDLIRISELDAAGVLDSSGILPLEIGGQTVKVSLSALKEFLFNDAVLEGNPQVPTANPGSNSLQAANTAFVQGELSGRNLGPATSSTPGSVRTNSTDAAPIVYLKSEIDAMNNIVQPVNLGGTGASDADNARQNLVAAKSGNNGDITRLQNLNQVPTVVGDAINAGANMPIGSLIMYLATSVPSRWLRCEGQVVNIADYPELASKLGNVWGGNGTTTFALPDFRGRSPIGAGVSAASGTNRALGTVGGADTRALTTNELPAHSHSFNPNKSLQAPNYGMDNKDWSIAYSGNNAGQWGATTIFSGTGSTGNGTAFSILHPFAAVHFIIKAL